MLEPDGTFQFDGATEFHEGFAWIITGKVSAYIAPDGRKVIPLPKGATGYRFSEGLAMVWLSEKNKGGIIDKTGRFVIPPRTDILPLEGNPHYNIFSEGYYTVKDNRSGMSGFIDKQGNLMPWSFKLEADVLKAKMSSSVIMLIRQAIDNDKKLRHKITAAEKLLH